MRFTVVVFACVLAAVNAQFDQGQYFPQRNQYQYNRFNQNNRFPYNNYNNNNRYQNYNPYKPYLSNPRPTVSIAKATASVAPSATPTAVPSVGPVSSAVASVTPFVALPVAKAVSDASQAETVKYGNEVNPDGSYTYFYETNNGIAAQSHGTPRVFGGDPPVAPSVADGAFSWISPEGQTISIRYVADENGYHPEGDAIPQAPPIPPLILRSLEYIATHAPATYVVDKN